MKNLSVLYHTNHSYDNDKSLENINNAICDSSTIYCYDPDNDCLFIHNSTKLLKIYKKTNDNLLSVDCHDIFGDVSGVCMWIDDGSIHLFDKSGIISKISGISGDDDDEPVVEILGSLDSHPNCMEIGPDRGTFAIVDENWNVVTMTMDFDVLNKIQLEPCFIPRDDNTTTVDKSNKYNDSKKASITWRGDGNFFAVILKNYDDNTRQFKVFNREGVFMFTSELSIGLEEFIAWKPSGNLIATSQRLPNKHVIALFEKNGLKHRELILPVDKDEIIIKKISWSPDSDILTIWAYNTTNNDEFLQLWTENNYHWYLKQTINFTNDNPLIYFEWVDHLKIQKKLILLMKKTYMTYTFHWCIDHSRGICDDDYDKSVVGVIDGNKLLLTGFKIGIVPPPMSHDTITSNQSINKCFFAPNWSVNYPWKWLDSNALFCQLSNGDLSLYIHEKQELPLKYKYINTYTIEWNNFKNILTDNFSYLMHHFVWLKPDIILSSISINSTNYLIVIEIKNINDNEDSLKNAILSVKETYIVDGNIHHIVAVQDVDIAFLVVDNSVVKFSTVDGGFLPAHQLPELCDQIEVVKIDNEYRVVTLGRKNTLCIDGVQVAHNITSMSLHSDFLLLTTFQHALVCVKIDREGFNKLSKSDLTVKSWESECPEGDIVLSMRRLERGSTLVITINHDSKTILQMPRGNLETIQPRSLSLNIIKKHLDNKNYYAAFDLMRKQRINLNLIYDHNPNLFILNAVKFVDDIKSSSWLNIFISELQDQDVTKTIYKTCYSELENNIRNNELVTDDVDGKVERICKLLCDIFEKKISTRDLVQPILTCLVKNKQTKGLEGALCRVKEFGKAKKTQEDIKNTTENALKYLLYLVDVNVLFDIALGMYDLEIAKVIGFMSQKDPKEFIPYLNSLSELDDNSRKFQIDKDLKRWESCLIHISKCPERFNECIEIICTHNLYLQALKIFNINTNEYMKISNLAGEYYMKNKKYREAGMMFQRSKNYKNALDAYKLCGSWQDVISVSTDMNLSNVEMNELYQELVDIMTNDKRYRDAADICYVYLKQSEETVALLCEGKEWRDALRISKFHKRPDLIETHVKPGVIEHAEFIKSRLINYKNDFLKYQSRLDVVRKLKAIRDSQNNFLNDDENCGDMSDLLSVTSFGGSTTSKASKSSRSSGRTYKSSKNRRKQERKVLSIKEGSAFEDLALIRALYDIITCVYELRQEVNNVNKMLMHFYMDQMAEMLQNLLIGILDICEKSKYKIWIKTDTIEDDGEENLPNSLLETKYTFPPEAKSVNWKLEIL
ncbi:hypothetical protein HCN44_008578 [Aphidius gifuensis]|uniref:Elongator complex protein 1 n=1 Tax=Aphidius gifuensis TaxID=684658 RepID=A0A834XRG2_APHGI|nr:putative elongator complex protein 1 [Aphidius gifuensis]KAF7989904.1 hypothetical protein HCN44_008578 [Aphidius gifuensis]